MRAEVVLSLLAFTVPAFAQQKAPWADDIAAIRSAGLREDPGDAMSALRHLRERGTLSNAVLEELLGYAANPKINTLVRMECLRLSLQRLPDVLQSHALAVIDKLIDEAENPGRRDDGFGSVTAVISTFVEMEKSDLPASLWSSSERLRALEKVVQCNQVAEAVRAKAANQIAEGGAPLTVRQETMLAVLEQIPGGVAPEGFFELLDRSIIARIRDIAFEDLEHQDQLLHPVPFELLAHYGDKETAERLRAWGHARGYADEQISRVGGFVWKIDAHHSPEMLLAYLRTGEWYDYTSRLWALKKAIELDVDRAELRAALLTHFSVMDTDDRLRSTAGALAALAIEQGILTTSDVEGVDFSRKTSFGSDK